MKRLIIALIGLTLWLNVQIVSAGDLFEEIKKIAEDSVVTLGTPIVEGFGIAAGGGLYHTASTHGTLRFDVGLKVMVVRIPEGQTSILDDANVTMLPLPVAQVNLGLPLGIEAMVRGVGYKYQDQTVSLIGIGAKKDLKSYIPVPLFPDLAVIMAYHSFKGGDVLKASVLSFDLIASKSFLILQPYVGLGFDKTSMDFSYTYTDPTTQIAVPVDVNVDANTSRFTIGLRASIFPLVKVYADYNISKYSAFTAGLAVGL